MQFFLLMHSNKKFEKKKVNTIKESLSENVPLRDRNQMYIIMKNTQSLSYHMLLVTSSTLEMSAFKLFAVASLRFQLSC